VCFGGSAGGLKAYVDILHTLPVDTGMAFVIAPHRAPSHANLLSQILSRATTMPVIEVKEGMKLAANHVFIAPPRMNLSTCDGAFQVRTTPAARGWPKTINVFLNSLAESVGNRAVAVILSGLDGDGSAALKTIKDAGGITLAQSDASFDSMPSSAVETGHVDHLLPATEIAVFLAALASEPLAAPEDDGGRKAVENRPSLPTGPEVG